MHRFFLPPHLCRGDRFELSEPDAHHAARVLRLQPGDPVVVLDGEGAEIHARVADLDRRRVTVAVTERRPLPARPPPLVLAAGLLKGRAWDLVLQKATELGAVRLVPLELDRSVVRVDPAEAAERRQRWEQVTVEAAKQCGTRWLPRVDEARRLEAWLDQEPAPDLLLVAALDGHRRSPRQAVGEFRSRTGHPPRSVTVVIGPEGDFTPEELARLGRAGAVAVTLGRNVLRAETAALAALAILGVELAEPPPPSAPGAGPVQPGAN